MSNVRDCGCNGNTLVRRFSSEQVLSLHKYASKYQQHRFVDPKAQVSLLDLGANKLALEAMSTDEADKASYLVFNKMDTFGGLELKFKKFDIYYPKLDAELWFSVLALEGSQFKVEGTLTIHCDDIANPSGCSASLALGSSASHLKPLINWDCVKNCAPQCISCGGDWQCWLGCAGGCLIQCM